MDKLIELLASKIAITLSVIIGILLPSFFLIFIWNRSAFYQMDSIKLLMLSTSIGVLLLAINFLFIYSLVQFLFKKEIIIEVSEVLHKQVFDKAMLLSLFIALFVTFIEILFICYKKILISQITIKLLIISMDKYYVFFFGSSILFEMLYSCLEKFKIIDFVEKKFGCEGEKRLLITLVTISILITFFLIMYK